MNIFATSYAEMPHPIPLLVKSFFNRKPRLLNSGTTLAPLEGRIESFEPPIHSLDAFRKICGYDDADSDFLPTTFPHIVANPILLDLLTSTHFPLRPFGLVHVKHEINQIEPVPDNHPLNIKCGIGNSRVTKKGVEFDITSEVYIKNKLVWNSIGSILSSDSAASSPKPKVKKPKPMNTEGKIVENWDLPADLGLRYAKVSGDFNPIHLHTLTSRLFGFKSPIIHGMWTMSRIAASLSRSVNPKKPSFNISCVFKAPIFLPQKVCLVSEGSGSEQSFRVTNEQKTKDLVVGRIEPAKKEPLQFEQVAAEEEYTPAPTTMHEQELFGD